MKKIALLLAALTVLGLLAGCKKEEPASQPNYTIPNSNVNIQIDDGWVEVEDTPHNVELTKNGVTMMVDSYISTDFADMPPLEELFDDCNYILFRTLSDEKEIEAPQTYEAGTKTIIHAMYTAQTEDGLTHFYCLAVDFHDIANTITWVCFSGNEKDIKGQRAEMRATVESMVTSGVFQSQEEIDAILSGEYIDDGAVPDQEYIPIEQDPEY